MAAKREAISDYLFLLVRQGVCLFDIAHLTLEISNQLEPLAAIWTQFEIPNPIMKPFAPQPLQSMHIPYPSVGMLSFLQSITRWKWKGGGGGDTISDAYRD